MIHLPSGPTLPVGIARGTVYLPIIHAQPPYFREGQIDKARHVFECMKESASQRRVGMVWDERLATVARNRCEAQAWERWTGHVDPGGCGPNFWVRVFWRYPLPDWYSQEKDANNIESLAHGGAGMVEDVWLAWMESEHHAVHLLGLNDFYAGQTQVGVGFYAGGEKGHYWCVLSVHPEGA